MLNPSAPTATSTRPLQALCKGGPNALLVHPDTLFINRRVQLATLAVRYAVPAIYPFREDAEAGGLMSYGRCAS
jgi:putative tryptophan/tyrosine transport system substrate-binding protein